MSNKRTVKLRIGSFQPFLRRHTTCGVTCLNFKSGLLDKRAKAQAVSQDEKLVS